MEHFDFSDTVDITKDTEDAVGEYHTFFTGQRYSVNDLVRSALVFSSNDAAYALAYHWGYDDFVALMNKKAQELGMTQTHFVEPSGLSYLNQSTAQDLYTLVNYIYHTYPVLFETTRRTSVTVHDLNSGDNKTFSSNNSFAGRGDFFGGKTGYIDEWGRI